MMLENGYETKTTFWSDFTIADAFGVEAIRDTYTRAFEEWKNNIEYVTELVVVLNHKIWQWYEKDEGIARVYNDLWMELDNWVCENYKDKELEYYIRVTD